MGEYSFTKPIVILSSPRSGSTLLYETLIRHQDLCSIRGESHAVIEQIPALNPVYRNFAGNNLAASDASKDIVATIKQRFANQLVNVSGQRVESNSPLRFVEKTPKNSLRVPFIKEVFPDATFIYLVRDPIKNIASIMEAWLSGRFVTYPSLPGWGQHWSLLLPEGWQALRGKSLAEVAAFQWISANDNIIKGLANHNDVVVIKYDEFVNCAGDTTASVCKALGLHCTVPGIENQLPLSAYTLTPPSDNKWKKHETALRSIVKIIQEPIEKINRFLASHGLDPLAVTQLSDLPVTESVTPKQNDSAVVSRNSPCPCGSNRRYKHCHGKL